MNIDLGFCEYPKSNYFFGLFVAYAIALTAVAHVDDRFLREWARFGLMPFSVKRFGPAAVVSILSVSLFVAIVLSRC